MSENLKIGDYIGGKYEILRIMKGGGGVVYLVQDKDEIPKDNITPYGTALKTFQDKYLRSDRAINRFNREALTWIDLSTKANNTNIVKATKVIKHYEKPFIVLDFIHGLTLGYWIKAHKKEIELSLIEICLDLAAQVAHGMKAAQKAIPGIVHRDIKPENIIIKEQPQGYEFWEYPVTVKITDFGLVKVLEENDSINTISSFERKSDASLSDTDWELGSYFYRSPEQYPDSKSVTHKSDIYSFGIMLFEMLTVGTKYRSKEWYSFMETMRKELPENSNSFYPKKFNDKISSNLNALIMKCLEKYPENRFDDFGDLFSNIQRIADAENFILRTPFFPVGKSEIDSLFDKALSHANLGLFEESIKYLNRVIEKDPTIVEAYANKGNCQISLGHFNDAMKSFDKALSINPQHTFALLYKGNCYHAMNVLDKAIEFYDKALSINSNCIDALTYKAGILCNIGNASNNSKYLIEARELLLKALEIDPLFEKALLFMGNTLSGLGFTEDAIEYFLKTTRITPNNSQPYYEIGRCYAAINEYGKAEKYFTDSINIRPEPDAYFNIGVCAFYRNNIPKAIKSLKKALELYPAYDRANQLLEICYKKL